MYLSMAAGVAISDFFLKKNYDTLLKSAFMIIWMYVKLAYQQVWKGF